MTVRDDDASMPAVARQQDILAKQLLGAGCNGEVNAVELRHGRDLLRGALVEVKLHLGILVAKCPDDRRQYITCLGVGSADRQRAAILVREIRRDALDVLSFPQELERVPDNTLAGRGDLGERPATAHEDIEPQLVLQQLELLADRRLGRTQFGRGGRNI